MPISITEEGERKRAREIDRRRGRERKIESEREISCMIIKARTKK